MRLSTWLEKTGTRPEDFADRIGVHKTAIWRYLRGARRPALHVAEAIERVTRGAVKVKDLV